MCLIHEWLLVKPYQRAVFWELTKTTPYGRKYELYHTQQCAKCGKTRFERDWTYRPVWRLNEIGPKFIFPRKYWKPESTVEDWGDGKAVKQLPEEWYE